MKPVFGFALYLAACIIVAIVAAKRGRSAVGFFLGCLVVGPAIVIIVSQAGGTGFAAGAGAFIAPIAGLVVALSAQTDK
jgi:hypothetical protein